MNTDLPTIQSVSDFDDINDPKVKLRVWQELSNQLSVVKELEMHARKSVVPVYFPDAKKIEGTQNFDLGNGYELKVVKKLNYNLGGNDKVDDMLDAVAKLGDEGKFISERLVSYKPSLLVSEYKKLDPTNKNHVAIKALIDNVLTINEGSPELAIIEPKARK